MQLPLFVLAAMPVRWFAGDNLDFGLCDLATELGAGDTSDRSR